MTHKIEYTDLEYKRRIQDLEMRNWRIDKEVVELLAEKDRNNAEINDIDRVLLLRIEKGRMECQSPRLANCADC